MKRTALLATSRADIRQHASPVLKLAGLTVTVAAAGLDAIRLARSRLPDVIVLDATLPDMDGATAADLLRSLPSTSDIPIIILDSVADPAMASPMSPGLPPISAVQLMRQVEAVVGENSARVNGKTDEPILALSLNAL